MSQTHNLHEPSQESWDPDTDECTCFSLFRIFIKQQRHVPLFLGWSGDKYNCPTLPHYDGPQGTCCKQKTIAANKKDALQTKNDRCKQKTIAANKKRSLQTKNDRCKQKTIAANKKICAANKKRSLQTKKMRCKQKNAVAIWPVTVQGFQNTKWPAVRYFQ